MSDSIVVSTPAYHPESLAVVIDICDVIQQKLLNLDNPILLRGAVAVGDFFSDGSILFGKGLVDAYLAQERYAIYPRIIISNEISVGRRFSIDGEELPKDEDKYYRIDSIERYLNVKNASCWADIENTEKYEKLKMLIDNNLNNYNDEHIRQKYLWLEKLLFLIRQRIDLKNCRVLVADS